jgi:hypothetical protein
MKKSELKSLIKEIIQETKKEELKGFALLQKVKKDWGEDSDFYGDLEGAVLGNDIEEMKEVVKNYDSWQEYKRYFNSIEEKSK